MLLTLPRVSPEIPGLIDFAPARKEAIRLALSMSRLGMISDADVRDLNDGKIGGGILTALLDKTWNRIVGDEFTFRLISTHACLVLPGNSDENFIGENGERRVGVTIDAAYPEWIAIGKAISCLEEQQAGLGWKALCILESTLWRFGIPHTARGAFEIVRNFYWYGADDESEVLAEYEEDADDIDVPRHADLFGKVPAWAYVDATKLFLDDEDFALAADRLTGHRAGKLISALERLSILESDEALFAAAYDADATPNSPPIVCGWENAHDFDPLFDDHFRYLSESGEEPPWVGSVMFPPTEEGISEALPRIHHTGQVLKALDAVLIEARDLHDEL